MTADNRRACGRGARRGPQVDLTGAVRRHGEQNFVVEAAGWIYRFPRGRMLLDNDFTSDNIVLDAETGLLSGVWDFSGVTVGPASFDFRARCGSRFR